jgi:tRNA(Ile)-lysidine synthetase-like protein
MIKFNKQIFNLALSKVPHQYTNVILLCSSGVDSVAASHYFVEKYKRQFKFGISSLHFNHKMRLQNFVMAEKYRKFSKEALGQYSGVIDLDCKGKTEAACRSARLNWIQNYGRNTIFITAHHLDDCCESYLMNVLRGKEGFLPVPFISEFPNNVFICHPFLETKKQDFIDYVEKHNLTKYVEEDETNKITKGSRRNMIRNEMIPLLNEHKMGIQTIVRKKLRERLALELLKS